MALLELIDVHTYYGAIHALRGVSLYVDEGEIVTLIGSNGAGKSTTLRSISGQLHVRQGEIKLRGERYKSYAEKFIPPVTLAAQQLANSATNVRLFLTNDFHMKSGMKSLIDSFYRSITDGTPPPVPYREILLTARIMDAIFDQIYPECIPRPL
jgi:ABC-type histidine transport system ATPase subunit